VTGEGVVGEPAPASEDAMASTVPAVYLVPFHRAECSLAGGLLELLNCRQERLGAFAQVDWHKALGWLRSQAGLDLAPGQQEAVKLALRSKVAVLTGGPGCGKSFTVRSIVKLATAKNAAAVLVAPTGRAARRLAELTGHEASTVHRLLQLQPGGDPKYDRGNPLDADLVVVDESSMMDVILASKLVKAIPAGAHLLMAGDVDQLPSVGAVLTDEDEPVDYDFAELDELAHAYAVTIHRSQGSEYPAVVIPLTTASWMMLRRNLLYTGVTRARKLIVLAGSRRALAQAVRTPRSWPPPHRAHPPTPSRRVGERTPAPSSKQEHP
jgi:ATP-dependent exoDNAse (exonuclease V) alpha subunit